MAEELTTVMRALEDLQSRQSPALPAAKREEMLQEALALLKGNCAPTNSKSPAGRSGGRGVGEKTAVEAKPRS